MSAANSFMPKQALQFEAKLLVELQGNVTDTIARDLLNDKNIPNFDSTAVIHDNGCGYGACTVAIMATNPPAGIQIHATDINPMFLGQLQNTLIQNPSWPVETETMDACNQTFPDNKFTHSFTHFIFVGLKDDVSAAKHILRTLQPGGTGVIALWNEMPWHVALENAHHNTRGVDEPMAPILAMNKYKKEQLEQALTKAGCEDVRFIQKAAWVELGPDLKRWATIAWTILASPVGGWQKRDEEKWNQAIEIVVKELQECETYKIEDGIHKIRMVADVAILHKI